MRPADAAVPVWGPETWHNICLHTSKTYGQTKGRPGKVRRHHSRADGPEAVVEEPWHLTSHSCRPKYAEVRNPTGLKSNLKQ